MTNDYSRESSVTSMLDHLEWETLESRRTKNQLTMLFKIIHGLVDIPAADYLTPANTHTRSYHSMKFRQFSSSSDYFKFSFFPHSVTHWNTLPATVAESPDLVSFKQGISHLSF